MPSENEVTTQIDRILASRWFARSERLCRFVRFAAHHAMCSGAGRLKEYVVGVEVFDRGPDYDPRIDPIVRVEARRLRTKLKAYYASAGRDDQLRIEFPKGSYSPLFKIRPSCPIRSQPVADAAIAVLPFENLSNSKQVEAFGEGLTEELIHQLAQVPGLQVVVHGSDSGSVHTGRNFRYRGGLTKWNVRGSIRDSQEGLRIIVQLIDSSTGAYLWSDTYKAINGDVLSSQDGIAGAVVSKIRSTLDGPRFAAKAS